MDQSTTLASPAGAPWAASLSTTRETALTGPIAGADGCDTPCSNGPPTPPIRLWSARSEGRWFRSWPRTTARYNLARAARNGRRAGAPVETTPPRAIQHSRRPRRRRPAEDPSAEQLGRRVGRSVARRDVLAGSDDSCRSEPARSAVLTTVLDDGTVTSVGHCSSCAGRSGSRPAPPTVSVPVGMRHPRRWC